MIPSFRRGLFLPYRGLALCGLGLAALALPGCGGLIAGPKVADKPKIVKKAEFPVFDAADYLTTWPTKMPGTYRVTGVTSGELLTIQGVNAPTVNAAPGTKAAAPQYGVPETVRLAGIVAPAPGQPGWQNTVGKVNEWVGGTTDLEVEVDPKFPVDLQNHRMVQIYFHPKGKDGKPSAERWNLNRMLIHTGYAVVDLFGATSVNVQQWLNDEEFAKNFVNRNKPTIEVIDPTTGQRAARPNVEPLGLWGLGITVPQRGIPARGNGTIMVVPAGSTSAIGSTVQGTVQSRQTTRTQQTTRTTTQGGASSTGLPSGVPATTAPAATAPSGAAPSSTSSTTSTTTQVTNSVSAG